MKKKIFGRFVYVLLGVLFLTSGCSNQLNVESGDESWSFVVFSDVASGYGIYGQLAEEIGDLEPVPDFAICLGDIQLRNSNEAEWEYFWKYSQPLTEQMPLYLARGNHEGNDDMANQVFREQSGIPGDVFYYSFAYFRCCFIVLDTYEPNEENNIGAVQLEWLKQQLDSVASLTQIQNIFLFMHHPVFATGKHLGSQMENAEMLHELFKREPKIRGVFAGHDHLFKRIVKDGVIYITSGGGGSPLHYGFGGDFHHFLKISIYEESGRINVKAIGLFNEVVEDFDL